MSCIDSTGHYIKMENQLSNKAVTATKWSLITEIAAKLVSPISTMILARLLAPDAFGVLVTASMVISFAEIFTDAGFQKYLVQHEFRDNEELYKSTAVAFWSNLILSLIIWGVICLFSPYIAHFVGNDGHGLVIAISCVCIPLGAFSSIQSALFRRSLDFKTLFIVRSIGIFIPLVVTIPLALVTHSYWSLIIGMIALNSYYAIILTLKSPWKPQWYYDVSLFKDMFSFTIWSMIEAITIWFTNYLDVFLVGTVLSTYYIGIYRTSINTVGQIMAIITSSTAAVLFPTLSRLQNNEEEFNRVFFKFQKYVALFVMPIGIGLFLYKDLVTEILLGDQWKEAAYMIGWWGLTSAITIVLSYYCSEVYRSKGKPKYSVMAQMVHLVFLIPTVLISVKYGFQCLCLSRSLVRFTLIGINLILLYSLTRITPISMITNISHSCIASIGMCLIYFLLPKSDDIIVQFIEILLCVLTYFGILLFWKTDREIIFSLPKKILKK